MAKGNRKSRGASAAPSGRAGADVPYTLWSRGNVKAARAAARELLGADVTAAAPAGGLSVLSDAQRESLQQLLVDTAPDPRALQVGIFALAVIGFVVLLTKLFS